MDREQTLKTKMNSVQVLPLILTGYRTLLIPLYLSALRQFSKINVRENDVLNW